MYSLFKNKLGFLPFFGYFMPFLSKYYRLQVPIYLILSSTKYTVLSNPLQLFYADLCHTFYIKNKTP